MKSQVAMERCTFHYVIIILKLIILSMNNSAVPSSFEVPPLPVIKIVLQLGLLGEANFHTISVGYQFKRVYSWAH